MSFEASFLSIRNWLALVFWTAKRENGTRTVCCHKKQGTVSMDCIETTVFMKNKGKSRTMS